jgi:hypothetical protein
MSRGLARDYALAVAIKTAEQAETKKPTRPERALELALYLTQLELAATHKRLILRSAMSAALKTENYLTVRHIVSRLTDLRPLSEQAEKDVQNALLQIQATPSNAHEIGYDARIPFKICGESLKPLYR